MIDYFRKIITSQFEASLCMLNDCIEKCPAEHWDGKIASYAFWHVAYHTLCFVDYYLSANEEAFKPREIHPKGMDELNEEFPSRRFEKDELIGYLAICRRKMIETVAGETAEMLERESGFSRLRFSRGELHLYNLRHVQHHTGQLSAYLRRVGVEAKWVGTGWK